MILRMHSILHHIHQLETAITQEDRARESSHDFELVVVDHGATLGVHESARQTAPKKGQSATPDSLDQ